MNFAIQMSNQSKSYDRSSSNWGTELRHASVESAVLLRRFSEIMQYYTKQQLQGAGGYSPGVRVGNWNEEANMQETKLKELLLKQQEGSLKLNMYAR